MNRQRLSSLLLMVALHTGPREQINQVTSFLDGSVIYGSSKEENDELRAFSGGLLKVQRCPANAQILMADTNQIDCKTSGRFKYVFV